MTLINIGYATYKYTSNRNMFNPNNAPAAKLIINSVSETSGTCS